MNHRPARFKDNIKPAALLMVIPFLTGLFMVYYVLSGAYNKALDDIGAARLQTVGWQAAVQAFVSHTPTYARQYAYYKVRKGQTLAELGNHFSVSQQALASLNPGPITAGTTIRVPPVGHALAPTGGSNNLLTASNVTVKNGIIYVSQPYTAPQATTTIPALMTLLSHWNAIARPSGSTYVINAPLYIQNNIRLDITSKTVTQLELSSTPYHPTCLVIDNAEALIQNTAVTTFDPATGGPDTDYAAGRSFVLDRNGRLDILNSSLTFLGNAINLHHPSFTPTAQFSALENSGGTYGVSYRISNGSRGTNMATGWVQGTTFAHNYFGAYTFGASGITWSGNHFTNNVVYGLDPHDDSDNALIIGNVFADNGKHGFIMSKRCDYNIIENNVSYDNRLHGFMLHDNSSYNLVKNNIAYGNTDNFVVYDSNYNLLYDNQSYDPHGSSVRISDNSRDNYVVDNTLIGGVHGLYVYAGSANVDATGNTIEEAKHTIGTEHAQNVLFANNSIDHMTYAVAGSDRLIFGPNYMTHKVPTIPRQALPTTTKTNILSSIFALFTHK